MNLSISRIKYSVFGFVKEIMDLLTSDVKDMPVPISGSRIALISVILALIYTFISLLLSV